jgi:hypothetical protein
MGTGGSEEVLTSFNGATPAPASRFSDVTTNPKE